MNLVLILTTIFVGILSLCGLGTQLTDGNKPTLSVSGLIVTVLLVVWLAVSWLYNEPVIVGVYQISTITGDDGVIRQVVVNKHGRIINVNSVLDGLAPEGSLLKETSRCNWSYGIHWGSTAENYSLILHDKD